MGDEIRRNTHGSCYMWCGALKMNLVISSLTTDLGGAESGSGFWATSLGAVYLLFRVEKDILSCTSSYTRCLQSTIGLNKTFGGGHHIA
jgi:hypothetical protein